MPQRWVWKNNYGGVVARVYCTMVTFAAVAFVWFLNCWNLSGWRGYHPPTRVFLLFNPVTR